jgi:hypothetical protein
LKLFLVHHHHHIIMSQPNPYERIQVDVSL